MGPDAVAWADVSAALVEAAAAHGAGAVQAALGAEAEARCARFLDGVAAYRRHPYRRAMPVRPVLWSSGTTRLYDHRPPRRRPGRRSERRPGRPVLVVPSLINRADILDLAPDSSAMARLAGAGLQPFLLDWAEPGETERRFGLAEYVGDRLTAAVAAVTAETGEAPVLVGYCMGGMLALACAVLAPGRVAGLVLLATPWDFHAGEGGRVAAAMLPALRPWLEPAITGFDGLPVDLLQTLFAGLDPLQVPRKFRRFADLDPAGAAARRFVALEDWVNDGVPLVAAVARECLFDWYGDNTPARRRWAVAGHTIDPARLDLPALVVVPRRDRIVPPESAAALAAALPRARRLDPPAGHVGMVAGTAAPALWREVTAWLRVL